MLLFCKITLSLSTDSMVGANVLLQFTLSNAKVYFQHAEIFLSAYCILHRSTPKPSHHNMKAVKSAFLPFNLIFSPCVVVVSTTIQANVSLNYYQPPTSSQVCLVIKVATQKNQK